MNDPDRRQTSDGFDHDAMFADIVAHWNDVAAEPSPGPAPIAEGAPGDALGRDETPQDEAAQDESPREETPQVGAFHDEAASDPKADDQTIDRRRFPSTFPPDLTGASQLQAIPAPQAWRAHEVDEVEEHFEPPPIAPLPVGDLQFWAIIAGMCGGPLLLLYLVFFNREAGSFWMLTAIAMSVGGFALLVSRLPRDREDNDDGARL